MASGTLRYFFLGKSTPRRHKKQQESNKEATKEQQLGPFPDIYCLGVLVFVTG